MALVRALAVGGLVAAAGLLLSPARSQVPPLPPPVPPIPGPTIAPSTTTTEQPAPPPTDPPAPAPGPAATDQAPAMATPAPAGPAATDPPPSAPFDPDPFGAGPFDPGPPMAGPGDAAPSAAPEPGPARAQSRSPAIAPAVVAGSYRFGAGGTLLATLLAVALVSLSRTGGTPMSDHRRIRLALGVVALALAAGVGLVGYLKLSLEPEVNRQIPYLASAGMALVLLAVTGGSLLVAEQLRADDRRIEELEEAVRTLAGALSNSVEAPPRRAAPTGDGEASVRSGRPL
ncbi:MAG: hypothetical protein KY458_02585 [Actinobacteria bacterium]|nr:hypothetical protein [Actinomycetota bacterium]